MNVVVVNGNVVADPKSFSSGKVVKFAIANDVKYGEKTTTSFFQITVFGKLANTIMTHVKKGTKLEVKGRLKQDTWRDTGGNKREKVGVIMEGFDFQNSPKSAGNAGGNPQGGPGASNASDASDTSDDNSEIPF